MTVVSNAIANAIETQIEAEVTRRLAILTQPAQLKPEVQYPYWLVSHFRELGLSMGAESMDNLVKDYYKGQEALAQVKKLEQQIKNISMAMRTMENGVTNMRNALDEY